LKQKDIRRLKTAEKKVMKGIAGYTRSDLGINEDIFEELKVDPGGKHQNSIYKNG
jgi:hypothetical protein